jgi:SulP family sulfate permease
MLTKPDPIGQIVAVATSSRGRGTAAKCDSPGHGHSFDGLGDIGRCAMIAQTARRASSVAALDAIETKYRDRGAAVTFAGLDPRSSSFHQRLTGQLGA